MSIWENLRDALSKIGAGLLGTPTEGTSNEPLQVLAPRALVIVYDPVMDLSTGERLTQRMGWNRVDDLVAGYIADIRECSRDQVQYSVLRPFLVVDEFPVKADGFQYDPASYMAVANQPTSAHKPDLVDYHRIVNEHRLIERVTSGEFDEVWLFGPPFGGFYESHMAGRDAFWCNSPAMQGTEDCPHRFIMMGFSYERGVGEMLEDLGHRAESILGKVHESQWGESNLWKQFSRYDKIAPGQAQVGMMHWAPNSLEDYDWGNRKFVPSQCDDWLNFPNLTGAVRQVNCADWGNGDIREHHKWWFKRVPKVAGRTNGISNNWWTYVIDPNNVR
jgi:hypothetical protein